MRANDYTLLMRSLDEALGVEEAERLTHLTHSSPEARAALDELHAVRHVVREDGRRAFDHGFADRVMQRLPAAKHVRAEAPAGDRPPREPRRRSVWASWGAGLAAVLTVVALAAAFWLRPRVVEAPLAATYEVALPDGSTVELAPGSALRYSRLDWWSARPVRLTGEAFFDVAHDERPFVVQTFNAQVAVQGTRFNVAAWRDDPQAATVVTLASGRVAVAPRERPERAVVLHPGQTTTLAATEAVPTPPARAEVDRATAWRGGGLAFVDRRLGHVARAIERRFGVAVTFADPTLADLSLTYLNPQPVSAEAVLSDVCHARGLRYRRTADGFTIYRP